MRAIICGASMALTITTAEAVEPDYFSANYALPGCKKYIAEESALKVDEKIYLAGRCAGIIHVISQPFVNGCANIPAQATMQQVMRVVVRYIEARPERMHESFMNLAIEAVRDAWCRK